MNFRFVYPEVVERLLLGSRRYPWRSSDGGGSVAVDWPRAIASDGAFCAGDARSSMQFNKDAPPTV
jgi:hypothetical protein